MRVQKYLHSCIGISHENQTILIDPGSFSFAEGILKPGDLPPADVILLTHEHPDHYYPEALKVIAQKKKPAILTHESLARLLEEQGMEAKIVTRNEVVRKGVFTIEAIEAPHGDLPMPKPENIGFLINDSFFHPGDSLTFFLLAPPKVLALPITASWLTLKDAFETAVRIKPEIVIPIHDAIMKDFMLERIYQMCETMLGKHGVAFHPLKLGEVFEIV